MLNSNAATIPTLPADMSRIINRAHYDRVLRLFENDESCLQVGLDDRDQRLMAPRIQPSAAWEAVSMQEEIFGPLLPIIGYDNEDKLIDRLKKMPSPLALYLFSREDRFTEKLIQAIPSGSVGINDMGKQALNLELPFGGVGASGLGRYRGKVRIPSLFLSAFG